MLPAASIHASCSVCRRILRFQPHARFVQQSGRIMVLTTRTEPSIWLDRPAELIAFQDRQNCDWSFAAALSVLQFVGFNPRLRLSQHMGLFGRASASILLVGSSKKQQQGKRCFGCCRSHLLLSCCRCCKAVARAHADC